MTNKNKAKQFDMKNGFLYVSVKFIFDNLKYLTIVEWLKKSAYLISGDTGMTDKKKKYGRVAVDFFIITKWILIFFLWSKVKTNSFCTFLTWYLIITNIYSYFYYHIWDDEAFNTTSFDKDRIRRRFVNLILAISYSNFCFAYLYNKVYTSELQWSDKIVTDSKSLWFSISNSLAANYSAVGPISDLGNSIAMIQLSITFIFVTIILSKSIP
jgi:hypothetical protein